MSIISEIVESASNKPGYEVRYDTEQVIRRILPEPAADLRRVNLRTLRVSDVAMPSAGDHLLAPSAVGNKGRLAADLIAQTSRCVAAGANVVLLADAPQPIQDSAGKISTVERPGGLSVSEAAVFSKISPQTPATDAALPVYRSMLDRSLSIGGVPTYAFRTTITRRESHRWAHAQLDDALLVSIVLGIGRAIDRILLGMIAHQNPAEFSIAAAAARGVRIDDLRAIVGTAGHGSPAWRGDGIFSVAGGVPAEITADMSDTLVGAFAKCGVIMHEEITLIAQRTNVNGDMSVTCLLNAESLLPVTGALLPVWKISA